MLPEGFAGQAKRKAQVQQHKVESIKAIFSDGLNRSSDEVSVMGVERRVQVI